MEKRVRDAVLDSINHMLRDRGVGKDERREARRLLKEHMGSETEGDLHRYAFLRDKSGDGQWRLVALDDSHSEWLQGQTYSTLGNLAENARAGVERGIAETRRPVGTVH